MQNSTEAPSTRGPLRIAFVTALGMTASALVLAAQVGVVTPPPVPDGIEVLAPNEVFFVGHGVGTQNYVCQPSPSIGRVAWTLFTPQATLFDDEQQQLTTHFFSPNPFETGNPVRATWQASDSSTVWARAVKASTDANFVAPGAIAWVKLEVKGAQPGPTGGDTLTRTTFIQRLNTVGGAAPTTGCDLPTDIGSTAFVPYTADYFFYRVPAESLQAAKPAVF